MSRHLILALVLVLVGLLVSPSAASTPVPDAAAAAPTTASGDGGTDDTAAIQSDLDAAAIGGDSIHFPRGTYRTTGSITWPSGVRITAEPSAVLLVTGDYPALVIPQGATGNTMEGLTFRGTMPTSLMAANRSQDAIKGFATAADPIRDLTITGVTFEDIEGIAIRVKHLDGFSITGNTFTHYGYAAVGLYSAHRGDISENILTGTNTYPSWSGNTYGVFLSIYEPDVTDWTDVDLALLSSDVTVHRNLVRDQAWEALDTHMGQRVSFVGNHISGGIGAGISVVGSDPSTNEAAKDLVIANNIIEYPAATPSGEDSRGGIIVRGAAQGVTGRKPATGTITGNVIKRMGLRDSDVSGGILVANVQGMVISGNQIIEPRSHGVVVQDSLDVVVSDNTVTDPWKTAGTSSMLAVTTPYSTKVTVTADGNRLIRGTLTAGVDVPAGSVIGWAGIYGIANTSEIVVTETDNVYPSGTAQSGGIIRQTTGVKGLRVVGGTAAPTTGAWLRGEQVLNLNVASGQPLGWVCVGSGTPGTWAAFGSVQ